MRKGRHIYHRRPATVEAVRFGPDFESIRACEAWLNENKVDLIRRADGEWAISVHGKMMVVPLGSILVKESNGIIYIYEEDVFHTIYV